MANKDKERLRYLQLKAKAGDEYDPSFQAKQLAIQRPRTKAEWAKKSFEELPWYDKVLVGAGRTAYGTAIAPVKRLLGGGKEIDDTMEAYHNATKGSIPAAIGETITDVAEMAIPLSKIAKFKQLQRLANLKKFGKPAQVLGTGMAQGVGSAGIHQMQNLGETGEADLMSGLVETGMSTVIPGGGLITGNLFKKTAPRILQSSVKPARKYMDKINPANFKVPLEKKLVSKFGGLEEAEYRTTKYIKDLAEKRDLLISNADIKINATDATRKVGKKLNDMVKDGLIYADDAAKAQKFSLGAINTAKKMKGSSIKEVPKTGNIKIKGKNSNVDIRPSEVKKGYWETVESYDEPGKLGRVSKGLPNIFATRKEAIDDIARKGYKIPMEKKGKISLDGTAAVKARILADEQSKFNPFGAGTGNSDKTTFNEAYRRVLEDEIENQLGKKGNEALVKTYKTLKKDMADVIPFNKSVQFRLGQSNNNYNFNLMDFQAMGLGGILTSGANIPTQAGASGVAAALRRLTATPGGADMLHSAGTRLTNPSKTKDLIMQSGRSLGFKPLKED